MHHVERKLLSFTPEQLFDLVADVERYPEFLPWCVAARIKKREGDVMFAELVVGFKMVRERYTSRIVLDRPRRIDLQQTEGPFKHLENHWVFAPADGGKCQLDFHIDFEFQSRFLEKLIGPLFGEVVKRMVGAFETRAAKLYGAKPAA